MDDRYIGIPLYPWMERWIDDCKKAEADADRLAEAIRRLDTVNPKMGQRYISTWEIARAALAAHEVLS